MKSGRNPVRHKTTPPAIQHLSPTSCRNRQVGKGAEEPLESVSLYSWSTSLGQDGFRTKTGFADFYSLFTFEALTDFSADYSKMLKECLLIHISSDIAARIPRAFLLRGFHFLLTAIHRDIIAKPINVDFLKRDIRPDLNGLHPNNRVRDMTEGSALDELDSESSVTILCMQSPTQSFQHTSLYFGTVP